MRDPTPPLAESSRSAPLLLPPRPSLTHTGVLREIKAAELLFKHKITEPGGSNIRRRSVFDAEERSRIARHMGLANLVLNPPPYDMNATDKKLLAQYERLMKSGGELAARLDGALYRNPKPTIDRLKGGVAAIRACTAAVVKLMSGGGTSPVVIAAMSHETCLAAQELVAKLAENAQRQINPAAWSPSRGKGEDGGEEEKEPLLTVRTTSPPTPSLGATANVDDNGGRGDDDQLQRRTSLETPGAGFVLDEASATYVRPT